MSKDWELLSADAGPRDAARRLSLEALLEGLETGAFTGDDQVRKDPSESWMALDSHPVFEETVRQIEEANRRPSTDETRLDMNPLIDVCLVLLIFFILTTSYAEMRKEVNPPPGKSEKKDSKTVMSDKQVKEFTIGVQARLEGEKIRYFVEKEPTEESELKAQFEKWIKKTGKASLTIEIEPSVPFRALIAIQDAATGAGVHEMIRLDRRK